MCDRLRTSEARQVRLGYNVSISYQPAPPPFPQRLPGRDLHECPPAAQCGPATLATKLRKSERILKCPPTCQYHPSSPPLTSVHKIQHITRKRRNLKQRCHRTTARSFTGRSPPMKGLRLTRPGHQKVQEGRPTPTINIY